MFKGKLQRARNNKVALERTFEALRQPLREKYSVEPDEFSRRFKGAIGDVLKISLPKVVLWKHNPKYILEGKTKFKVILSAQELNEISRPLVNLFRIGLNFNTLEDLKTIITEIQSDSSERIKHEDSLNENINDYINSVWQDYDQKIKISLEQEQILVQFYDPNFKSRSYYKMNERSQGCQTFISFLLTVGAEAKHGIIRDTVLLLDEPEIHLHPSGVRFMLQELIKAASHDNKVIFATHSIFMIDRDCYNRHVIIEKEKERTHIKPSRRDRIGYFMQEEVLYSTLDIDLNKDFDSTNQYNFVFEGDGDAKLFEQFYGLINKKDVPFDIKMTSFYQGGKCSDIIKYFKNRPIQLGSVWVFILDSDKAANELKKFIKAKYKKFLKEFIFVFQYKREDLGDTEIELEDLLPEGIIKKAIADATPESLGGKIATIISGKVKNSIPFAKYFKEICSDVSLDEEFKGAVKNALNKRILEEIGQVKNRDQFNEKFLIYSSWSQSVIDKIKGHLKEKDTKQSKNLP